jgi:hypothetical protein
MSEHQGSVESFEDKRDIDEEQGSGESFEDKRLEPHPEVPDHVSPESLARKHEVQGVSLRPLLIFTFALAVALLSISLILWAVIGSPPLRMQVAPAEVTPVVSAGPGIQYSPAGERREVVEPALERITTYGWVDREAGIVHIPVEEAMRRLAEETADE